MYTVRKSIKLYAIQIVFLYCKLFNKKKQLMNMMICSCRSAIRLFVWIESWIDGWMPECWAYFTVVHSHGVSYLTIRTKAQVARVNAFRGLVSISTIPLTNQNSSFPLLKSTADYLSNLALWYINILRVLTISFWIWNFVPHISAGCNDKKKDGGNMLIIFLIGTFHLQMLNKQFSFI